MKIIDLPRFGGKTTELVTLMLEPGNEDIVYVAPTTQQAKAIARACALSIAAERGIEPPSQARFIAARDITRLRGHYRFVIDEMDAVLYQLLGGAVVAGALTSVDARQEAGAVA